MWQSRNNIVSHNSIKTGLFNLFWKQVFLLLTGKAGTPFPWIMKYEILFKANEVLLAALKPLPPQNGERQEADDRYRLSHFDFRPQILEI